MKAKWLGVALGCAVLAGGAAGCGQGRAIFNVDVYSFLKGTGRDTLRLPPDPLPPLPPSTTVTDSVTPIAVNLPGAGSDRKSTRLNSSHSQIPYAVFSLKKEIDVLLKPYLPPLVRSDRAP